MGVIEHYHYDDQLLPRASRLSLPLLPIKYFYSDCYNRIFCLRFLARNLYYSKTSPSPISKP